MEYGGQILALWSHSGAVPARKCAAAAGFHVLCRSGHQQNAGEDRVGDAQTQQANHRSTFR